MMHCLYTGATGLKTHGEGLATVSHNLANVNTVGYKQQSMLFQDLMSATLASPNAETQGFSQLGMGAAVGDTRTLFTQGGFETGSSITDLAINGKGFFQVVSNDGDEHYTRAGNFYFDDEGVLRDPSGYALSGFKVVNGEQSEDLGPIQIDMYGEESGRIPGKATSQIMATINIGSAEDASTSESDPYFSLLNAWNGLSTPPLSQNMYVSAHSMSIYDAEGNGHEAQLYIDGTPARNENGKTTYEYVLGTNPQEDGSAAAGTEGAGLLMAGTLTFDSSGQLIDMTAFTPNGGDTKNLAAWQPAALADGLPQFTAIFAGSQAQNITLDLGVKGSGNAWNTAIASASEVGIQGNLLPSISPIERDGNVSTAIRGSSSLYSLTQDGYATGRLVNLQIMQDGVIEAQYSNNITESLYTIPLFRFTSEDGLYNEGMNHYSATLESGQAEYGDAGTSNYGFIVSNQLETSNVDMSREMVTMITVQRGFQMNSKVLTTADTMLQKALELKRN